MYTVAICGNSALSALLCLCVIRMRHAICYVLLCAFSISDLMRLIPSREFDRLLLLCGSLEEVVSTVTISAQLWLSELTE